MSLLRRTALLVAIFMVAAFTVTGTQAQTPPQSSSSSQAEPPASPSPAAQSPTSGALSVQARIRARREQRRAAAIQDNYGHLYEAYLGFGFQRFAPGDKLQHISQYAWNVGFTRYYSNKFGVTIDGRGEYGTAYLGDNQFSLVRPAISEYLAQIGPTYRIWYSPRYSLALRAMAGGGFNNFFADANGYTASQTGLYPDGASLAASAGAPFQINISPTLAWHITPEYTLTTFGSSHQASLGVTTGVTLRFGKR